MSRIFVRTSFKLLIFLFVTASIIFVAFNSIVVFCSANKIYSIENIDELETAQCVLVPGSRVFSDERLSAVLQDRVDYAIEIYKAGKAERLLFSGDHGRTEYDEVNAMLNYAVSKGVPQEDIFLDHAGFSTYESLYRARDVFCVSDVIIVTQKFHIYRAVFIAQQLGLETQGVNSDPRRYLYADYDSLRESFARVKDLIYVNILKPKPKYLGDEIPITGNSSLTHDK